MSKNNQIMTLAYLEEIGACSDARKWFFESFNKIKNLEYDSFDKVVDRYVEDEEDEDGDTLEEVSNYKLEVPARKVLLQAFKEHGSWVEWWFCNVDNISLYPLIGGAAEKAGYGKLYRKLKRNINADFDDSDNVACNIQEAIQYSKCDSTNENSYWVLADLGVSQKQLINKFYPATPKATKPTKLKAKAKAASKKK